MQGQEVSFTAWDMAPEHGAVESPQIEKSAALLIFLTFQSKTGFKNSALKPEKRPDGKDCSRTASGTPPRLGPLCLVGEKAGISFE